MTQKEFSDKSQWLSELSEHQLSAKYHWWMMVDKLVQGIDQFSRRQDTRTLQQEVAYQLGKQPKTIQNWCSIGRKFTPNFRAQFENADPEHFWHVRDLQIDVAEYYLSLVESNGISPDALKWEISQGHRQQSTIISTPVADSFPSAGMNENQLNNHYEKMAERFMEERENYTLGSFNDDTPRLDGQPEYDIPVFILPEKPRELFELVLQAEPEYIQELRLLMNQIEEPCA